MALIRGPNGLTLQIDEATVTRLVGGLLVGLPGAESEPDSLAQARRRETLPLKLDVHALAEFLDIGVGAAYRLLRRTDFPSVLIGAKRRIVYRDALLRWLDAGGTPWQPPAAAPGKTPATPERR